ncbi:type I restriction enzyme, S subunit [Prevotella communis]|uniref:Type I restriction enzyme, S subunit n=1 Tax=Prevotella communis TaxID=2913614 RepID=A0A1H0KUL6_9BACT|nr:restriction endonuclease subunit S [Prevotella communis]SDG91686.1 type I restriction enzyme, S subunit [Prevotella communis]SDO59704.1 type I restriction enzyme, S subunit [Prevotella communis]
MKEGWTYKKFADCIDKIPKQRQVKSKDYKSTGLYPIVSQEKELISGYWDDESYLYKHSKPIIIFGDHTKVVKYVDFDFVVGADGTQILSPKSDVDAKYFYYTLLATPIRTLGYARHFKLLKERSFKFPSLSEQQRIVSRLDSAFAHIDERKANAEKQLSEARALFQKALTKAMEPKEGWEEKTLSSIVHKDCSLSYGIVQPGDHKEDGVPVVRPVDFNNKVVVGHEGLKRTDKEISDAYKRTILKGGEILFCVRGTTGTMGLASKELKGCNVTRGIVPIYFDKEINLLFMYYQLLSPSLQDEIQRKTTGAALKQINIKDLRNLQLFVPSLSEQQRIVSRLDSLSAHVRELEEVLQKTIAECDALKQALLRQVFE